MKVSKAQQNYWQQQRAFDTRLEKQAELRRTFRKEVVRDQLELTLYRRHVRKLELIELAKLGKNIDVYS